MKLILLLTAINGVMLSQAFAGQETHGGHVVSCNNGDLWVLDEYEH